MHSFFLADLVAALHACFVAWMVLVPACSGCLQTLCLHALVAPFLMLHWVLHNDGCALTMIKKHLRGVDDEHSFMWNLVNPIYVIEDSALKQVVFVATVVLWGVTLFRLFRTRFWVCNNNFTNEKS